MFLVTSPAVTMRFVSLIVFLVVVIPTATGQAGLAVGVFVGSNEFEEEFGQEVYAAAAGGASYTTGLFLLTADGELDFISREDPDSPYYWDSSVDRCRDSRNGQFASSSLCGGGALGGAVTGDASIIVPATGGLSAGVGYRLGLGSSSAPYLTLGYALGGYQAPFTIRLKAQASQRLVSFGALLQLGI